MQFSLTGQSQNADVRTYAFNGNASGQKGRSVTVSVDIGAARRHAISLQELPLLCLRFLEVSLATSEATALTFSEGDMLAIAGQREEAKRAAALKHRPPRRPRPNPADPNDQWRRPAPNSLPR
jgi:hypothetical protein